MLKESLQDRKAAANELGLTCVCDGCAGRVKRFNECFTVKQVLSYLVSPYWSESSRQFFAARVTDVKHIRDLEGRETGGVMVIGTCANASGERFADFSTHCRYGQLVESRLDVLGEIPPANFRKILKSAEWMEWRAQGIKNCACHGCQIDRF